MSYLSTILLYMTIFISTTLLGGGAQKKVGEKVTIIRVKFFSAFFIHFIFLCFTNIGIDYGNYSRHINNVSLDNLLSYNEVGFSFLCYVIKSIVGTADITIFFIKLLTLILFYAAFLKVKDKVNYIFLFLTYNLFLYLQGLFIIGMQISIAFLFWSFIYLVEKDTIKALVTLIIAVTMHSSSMFFIPIYILFIFVNRKEGISSELKVVIVAIVYIVVYFCIGLIYNYAVTNIAQLRQYSSYGFMKSYNGTGLMQYLYFIPVFLFVFSNNKNSKCKRLNNLLTVVSMSAFLFALLGYRFAVLARINKSFFVLYGLLIPMFLYRRQNKIETVPEERYFFTYKSDCVIWTLYILIRGYDFFVDFMNLKSTTDIQYYSFFNPFKFR